MPICTKYTIEKGTVPILGKSSKPATPIKRFSIFYETPTLDTSINIAAQVVGLAGEILSSLKPHLNLF